MTFETLQYVDAGGATQEIALNLPNLSGNGGAVRLQFTPRSHAPSEFTIAWAQPPETGIAIPFKSRCIVRAGRISASGSPNTFSGGTILFQGRRWDNEGSSSAANIATTITLLDAWKDLEKVTYTIPWNYPSGGTIAAPTFSTFNWPDIVLFQAAPGLTYSPPAVNGTMTSWQQIQDLIRFVASYAGGNDAVQLQLANSGILTGTVWAGGTTPEFTPVYLNWYPVRSAKVAECLNICLRPHPAVYTEIDYTTTPPTLHFRNRAAMTAVTLPYKSTDAAGIMHIATGIKSLDELVPDNVRLFYKINGTFNGSPVINYSSDTWPDANNHLLSLDYSIDVTGSSTAQTIVNFVSTAFNPSDLTLWTKKVPPLKSVAEGGQVNGLALLATPTVKDDNGDVIDTGVYKYLTDQDMFSWMTTGGAAVTARYATITGLFSYTKLTNPPAAKPDTALSHPHHMRVLLTNAPSGAYKLNQLLNPGESIPANLAKNIYNELSALQWKLSHEIIQVAPDPASIPTLIKPGKHKLNLSGGNVAWMNMNAVPESVSIEFYRSADNRLLARHKISCGPVNHLEPGYLIQLSNLFWNRNRSGIDAGQRLTGTPGNNVDLSSSGPRENSMSTPPLMSIQSTLSADGKTQITQDAAGGLHTLTAPFTPR